MSTKTKKAIAPNYVLQQRGIRTQRQWRAIKRRDFKALRTALGNYRFGCAFCPWGKAAVGRIDAAINDLAAEINAKVWR